jgi:hypothetical protein
MASRSDARRHISALFGRSVASTNSSSTARRTKQWLTIKKNDDKQKEQRRVAGRRRQQRQRQNARRAQQLGAERNLQVGDYVFVGNGNVQKTKFANKALQSGPYKIVDIDIKAKRAQLERLADEQKLEKWTSINRLQKVSAEAVATKIDGVWAGEKDPSLLLDNAKKAVEENIQRQQAAQQAADDAQRERKRRDAAKEQARAEERERRAAQQRDLDGEARTRRRSTAQIPDDAVPEKRVYTTQGEIIIVSTANGKIGISRQHKQFNKLATKLKSIEAERKEINRQAQKKKQVADRFVRHLQRQARK